MNYVEIPNPTNGAAYQILFERLNPTQCATRERQAEIEADLATILTWAQSQPEPVMKAYAWAIKAMKDDVEKKVKVNELHQGVQAALASIPRPPA